MLTEINIKKLFYKKCSSWNTKITKTEIKNYKNRHFKVETNKYKLQ